MKNRYGPAAVMLPSLLLKLTLTRNQRDQRYAELQASGLDCQKENLYTVDRHRVFMVTATMPEEPAPTQAKEHKLSAPRLRLQRSPRPVQPFERR